MSKFALLKNNIVYNIIVADSLEEARSLGECIEYNNDFPAGIGWVYNEETKTFQEPIIEEQNA